MPRSSLRVNALNERREDVCFGIRSSSGDQDVVGMPIDGKYGRPERFLDMLGYPPIVLFVKRADSDGPTQEHSAYLCGAQDFLLVARRRILKKLNSPRSATDSELILLRTPLNTRRSPINSKQDQCRLPSRSG